MPTHTPARVHAQRPFHSRSHNSHRTTSARFTPPRVHVVYDADAKLVMRTTCDDGEAISVALKGERPDVIHVITLDVDDLRAVIRNGGAL